MPLDAVVIAPYRAGDRVIPAGTLVHGRLRFAKRVGLGLLRETAKMAIDFTELEPASGPGIPIVSRLAEVDNARERVDRKGVIRGIRATDSFSHRVGYRFLNLAMAHPAGFVPLLVLQTCIFHFPNPEIEYPAGTDLKVELREPLPGDVGIREQKASELDTAGSEELNAVVNAAPFWAVSTRSKDPVDIVNLVFLGAEDAIRSAFEAAGWLAPRRVSATARFSVMRAGAELRALPDAPMRTLMIDGEAADMSWQRSLNDTAKRHHLRIWKGAGEWRDREVWLSAATHDIDMRISLRHDGVTHVIEPKIDREREKVLTDLRMTGCVDAVHYVDRPEAKRFEEGIDRKELETDRRVAVVVLNACEKPLTFQSPGEKFARPSKATRVTRILTLSTKNYFLRCNWPWRIGDTGYMGFRKFVSWNKERAERRAREAAALAAPSAN